MKGNMSGQRESIRGMILIAIVAQNAVYTLARYLSNLLNDAEFENPIYFMVQKVFYDD